MVEERRQHSRLVPTSPTFVSLDHSKSGLLLDVGEGGLAIASLVPRDLNDVISVAFELPDGRGSIQAEAEIAWTRDSGHLTGARFVNVDDHSLRQLCDWISASPKAAPAAGEDQVDRAPEQLALIDEKERAEPGIEETDHSAMGARVGAIFEDEVTVVHDAPGNFSEPLETTETPAEFPAPEDITMNGGEAESAVAQDLCAEDAAAYEIPSHTSADPFPSIQGQTISDAPIFVTRSSYAQVAPAVSEVAHKPAMATANEAWQPMQDARAAGSQVLTELGLSSGAAKGRHTIELILAVVVLSWALVFLGYQMGSTGVSRQSASDAAAMASAKVAPAANGKSSEAGSGGLVPSVQASPAPVREASPALSVGDAGVVLQVGAMKLEDNADVLAQELQKKNMPAFVFRHGQDGLYHVAVGPFSDDDATAKMKAKLEKQGLKPIVRRWLPE